MDEDFSRQTGRFFRSNPDGLQGKATQYGGEKTVQTAFNGWEKLYQPPKYSELRDKIVAGKARNRRNPLCISRFFSAAIGDFGRKDAC